MKVAEFAKDQAAKAAPGEKGKGGDIAANRGTMQSDAIDAELKRIPADKRNEAFADALRRAKDDSKSLQDAQFNYNTGRLRQNQEGKLGVDLSLASNTLRGQNRLSMTANQQAYGRNCVQIGGVWIDDQFAAKTKTVVIKAQSDAYFRILELQPKMKDVFRLGNHLVWIAPNGTALVIDANDGQVKLPDAEIEALFKSLPVEKK